VKVRARPTVAEPLRWNIGDARVTRILEIEAGGMQFVIPDATRENLRPIAWLAPHFLDGTGNALGSIHALVIETEGQRIVVDTCVGNDKRRPVPAWNMRSGSFLEDMHEAGFPPESIDTVLCTHMHLDHVGWNTRLEGRRWVPSFPNARYLFARAEWEHWNGEHDRLHAGAMEDSVKPIFDAGLADLVETDYRVGPAVRLEPTPGHTPGHVSVRIESRGESAVITGDLVHHPCQFAHPEWGSSADWNTALAEQTRREFIVRHADGPTLVIGTHFAAPTAGWVRRDGEAWRLEV
jgi:glyoxylase-like metal-dependent hydrolase (beta-lactamase superfamily II)